MRVLIVEDEQRIASNISKYLNPKGFFTDTANEGNDAINMAEIQSYDIILIDRMLPDGDGLEICQKLRLLGITTPIIIITAKNLLEDKLEGLNCGADDYLTKPFDMEELLARIKAQIRRASVSKGSPILKVGPIGIDTNTCRVEKNGRVIDLAPKEYALLEYLALNKCKVISRITLLEHVWGDETDLLSNTVDVHIKYLRNKID